MNGPHIAHTIKCITKCVLRIWCEWVCLCVCNSNQIWSDVNLLGSLSLSQICIETRRIEAIHTMANGIFSRLYIPYPLHIACAWVSVSECECSEYVSHSWPTLICLSLQRKMCVSVHVIVRICSLHIRVSLCVCAMVCCKWLRIFLSTHSQSVRAPCVYVFVCLFVVSILWPSALISKYNCAYCIWLALYSRHADIRTATARKRVWEGKREMKIGRDTMAMYRWQDTSNGKKRKKN